MSKDNKEVTPAVGKIEESLNVNLDQYSDAALKEAELVAYEAEAASNIAGEGPLECAEQYKRPGFKLRFNNNFTWTEQERNRKLGYTNVIGADGKPVTIKDGSREIYLQEITEEKWNILQRVMHQENMRHEAQTLSPGMRVGQPEGQYDIKQSAHYRAISYRRMPNKAQ